MKLTSFWIDDYPRPDALPVSDVLPAEIDVAIVGGGYTGLSSARMLAKSGVSAVVIEREIIGWGASSRNAGITGCGLKQEADVIFKKYGEAYGHIFWQASLDALKLIKELAYEEGIDCAWQQKGDLCVFCKPSHYEAYPAWNRWHKENKDNF